MIFYVNYIDFDVFTFFAHIVSGYVGCYFFAFSLMREYIAAQRVEYGGIEEPESNCNGVV